MSYAVGAALYNKILQLIILPTEKCNFRCTYCYEDFEIGRMSRTTIDAIKKLITARIERTGLEQLSLSWFGGEPLLADDIVFEVADFAKGYERSGQLKSLIGDITTNGFLLTPPTLRRLVESNQTSFQVSLDGFGKGHDQTRKYINGKGTFDKIWANLLAAHKTDLPFSITIRCHQTPDNEEAMTELIENVRSVFGGDSRFNVFFKPIENLGGANAKSIKRADKSSIAERVVRLEQILAGSGLATTAVLEGPESATGKSASTIGVGSMLNKAEGAANQIAVATSPQTKLATYEGYICYAAKPNSLMIRADGTIGKCTVLMDDPRNRVGQLNPDGTVQLDADKIGSTWMRGFKSGDSMELGCPAQGLPKLVVERPVEFVR